MSGKNGNGAKPPADGWIVDINRLKRKELPAFQQAFTDAQAANDDSGLHMWAAKVIAAWPFPLDPTDPASYGELGLVDYNEAMRRFADSFRAVQPDAPVEDSSEVRGEGSPAGTPASVVA